MQSSSTVSTTWLASHLSAPDVKVVDSSWYLPNENRNPREEYEERHIPGAVFFDIDLISDAASPLPHMLPSADAFAHHVEKLGLGDGLRIIVYDGGNMMAAARVWWMFRAFGHEDIAILDGGLAKWLSEGHPVDDQPVEPRHRKLTTRFHGVMVRSLAQMKDNLLHHREQVVDARGMGRFSGSAQEPRPGLRSGHIPGSLNLHYASLLRPDCTLKKDDEIRNLVDAAGIDLDRPIITTCGSGISACLIALALDRIGARKTTVYDGSWVEWGSAADTPIETGVPEVRRL